MEQSFRIKTKNFILRPYTLDDVDNLYEMWSDPEIMKFIPEGLAEREFIAMIMPYIVDSFAKCSFEKFENFGFLVTPNGSDEVIGWCGMIYMFPFPEYIELFVGFKKPYWGCGYAEEIARALIEIGFDKFGIEEITAVVEPEHKASLHILKKIGLKFIKTISGSPERYKYYDGLFLYSIKKDEYFC